MEREREKENQNAHKRIVRDFNTGQNTIVSYTKLKASVDCLQNYYKYFHWVFIYRVFSSRLAMFRCWWLSLPLPVTFIVQYRFCFNKCQMILIVYNYCERVCARAHVCVYFISYSVCICVYFKVNFIGRRNKGATLSFLQHHQLHVSKLEARAQYYTYAQLRHDDDYYIGKANYNC